MLSDIKDAVDSALYRFDESVSDSAIAPEVLFSGNSKLMLRNLMESHFWKNYGVSGIRPARRFKPGTDWADLVLIDENDGNIVCGIEIRWQMKYDLKKPALGTEMTNTEHWFYADLEKLDVLEEYYPSMEKYFVLFSVDFPPGELSKNEAYLKKNPDARKFPNIDLVEEWKKCSKLGFEEELRKLVENECYYMHFNTEPAVLTMRHVPIKLRVDYCIMQLDRG